MQQAEDFMAESRALENILEPLTEAEFATPTLFKGWTIDDVIGHLHMFNVVAEKTLESDVAFEEFLRQFRQGYLLGEVWSKRNILGLTACRSVPFLPRGNRRSRGCLQAMKKRTQNCVSNGLDQI